MVGLTRKYGGGAFPAHIDKDSYSLLSSLGAIPPEAGFCTAEITAGGNVEELKRQHEVLSRMILLQDSDAHYLEHMPQAGPWIDLPQPDAECLIQAIRGEITVSWGRSNE